MRKVTPAGFINTIAGNSNRGNFGDGGLAKGRPRARERRLRLAVRSIVEEPLYYTVKRGDALSLIATKFEATPDQVRAWNHLESDRVKIGQRLLVIVRDTNRDAAYSVEDEGERL